jgi:hypothetical protein
MHKDIDALAASIEKWRKDLATYSPEELKSHLTNLESNFRTHLAEEVSHLEKSLLEPRITSEELNGVVEAMKNDAKSTGDPTVVLPFLMSHTAPEHKYWSNDGFFLYRVILPMLALRHYG